MTDEQRNIIQNYCLLLKRFSLAVQFCKKAKIKELTSKVLVKKKLLVIIRLKQSASDNEQCLIAGIFSMNH